MSFNFQKLHLEAQICIVSFLEEEDFKNFRSLSEMKYLFSYPNLERVYKERSKRFLTTYLSFREPDMKWKIFYHRVKNFLNKISNYNISIRKFINKNQLMEMKIYEFTNLENKVQPDLSDLHFAVEKNNINIVKHLLSKGLLPHMNTVDAAVSTGNIELVDLFASKYLIPSSEGVNNAILDNNITMLKHLTKKGALPDQSGLNIAATRGYFDVLEFLLEYDMKPNELSITMIISYERFNVLIWFESKGINLPKTQEHVKFATIKANLDILKWLKKYGILPTVKNANTAAQHLMIVGGKAEEEYIKVLNWFAELGIYPEQYTADFNFHYKQIKTLEWLKKYGILPKQTIPNKKYKN